MTNKKVAICYDPPRADAAPDLLDIFDQVEFVKEHLLKLGYMVINVPHKKVPEKTIETLKKYDPAVVWNLMETYNGREEDQYMGAIMLDNSGYLYTGCSAQSFLFCMDKVIVKDILRSAGANVPASYTFREPFAPGKWIIKPRQLHGSVGISDKSVINATTVKDLQDAIIARPLLENVFAERYVDGREYSATLIDTGNGLKTVAVAEMLFTNFDGKNKILGYDSKWMEGSSEYTNTNRTFKHKPEDEGIINNIKKSAEIIAVILDMKGFARIDFRVDNVGKIWVIDVNPNPGLGADSGFVAGCENAGISAMQAVDLIVKSAVKGGSKAAAK